MSIVTGMLSVAPAVVPVANVVVALLPKGRELAWMAVSDSDQVASTGVKVSVRELLAGVLTTSFSVAVSAPAVDGRLQPERSKRTNVQLRWPRSARTSIVLALP
jgi:hypothetical protein